MNELKLTIGDVEQVLISLKRILVDLNIKYSQKRIEVAIHDVNRIIEHAQYYINDFSRYNPSNFFLHQSLVSLIDSIRDNDFGVENIQKENSLIQLTCKKILEKVELLIKLNNLNKKIN